MSDITTSGHRFKQELDELLTALQKLQAKGQHTVPGKGRPAYGL